MGRSTWSRCSHTKTAALYGGLDRFGTTVAPEPPGDGYWQVTAISDDDDQEPPFPAVLNASMQHFKRGDVVTLKDDFAWRDNADGWVATIIEDLGSSVAVECAGEEYQEPKSLIYKVVSRMGDKKGEPLVKPPNKPASFQPTGSGKEVQCCWIDGHFVHNLLYTVTLQNGSVVRARRDQVSYPETTNSFALC